MSSDRPSAGPSPTAEAADTDLALAALVRNRGEPLLDALEEHLPGSRTHGDAAADYAFAAAAALGLARGAGELCREIARLHDVGMVYVPREVALEPFERLDESRRALFEQHYEAGARLALGAGIPDDACGWLLQIRERFDGAGPEGLGGDAIPLAARIARAACACDLVLSASARANPDEARRATIEALRAAGGRELDPGVVEALASVLLPEAAAGSPADARA